MSHSYTLIRAETSPPYDFDHESLKCQHIFQQQDVKHGLYVSHVDINVSVCKGVRKVLFDVITSLVSLEHGVSSWEKVTSQRRLALERSGVTSLRDLSIVGMHLVSLP
jgi:hypothetical protein